MVNTELDAFGIEKKFPDLQGGNTLVQDGDGWGNPSYTKHGYKSLPGVFTWRKTFSFNKKLQPNQEMTIYVYLPKLNPEYYKGIKGIGHCKSGSGLSIKLRGSTHSGSDDPKTAKCYIFHHEYEGGDCNNFQKEYPHPEYSKYTLNEDNQFPKWIGKVMGFKAAVLNTNDGKNVEFWSWFDPSAKVENGKIVTSNNWLLRYHGIDHGQFNKDPITKPPFLTCFGGYTEFRMDNVDKNTKAFCASLREIQKP